MTRRRTGVLLVVLSVLASACGRSGGDDALPIGVKRVALNLTFAKEELAKPVAPEVILRLLPPLPELAGGDLDAFRGPLKRVRLLPSCPVAQPGQGPEKPVTFSALRPPAVGAYTRHNKGTLKVVGPLPLTLPFPPASRWEIAKTTKIVTPSAVPNGDPATNFEWDIRKILVPGYEVIDSMRLLADRIELVKRRTINQGAETTFTPTPPVSVYTFGDEGSLINSAGIDTETNTAMVVQGEVERREFVDVCGVVIDTWRVSLNERIVNLSTGETSGSVEGDPNIYNFATQYGGIVVREDVHYTSTVRTSQGTPVVFEFEYVSTLDAIAPKPL